MLNEDIREIYSNIELQLLPLVKSFFIYRSYFPHLPLIYVASCFVYNVSVQYYLLFNVFELTPDHVSSSDALLHSAVVHQVVRYWRTVEYLVLQTEHANDPKRRLGDIAWTLVSVVRRTDQTDTMKRAWDTYYYDTLPGHHYISHSHEPCSICVQTGYNDPLFVRLPCGHTYHRVCISKWIMNPLPHSSMLHCPLCCRVTYSHRSRTIKTY